jgi:hypothetical protein
MTILALTFIAFQEHIESNEFEILGVLLGSLVVWLAELLFSRCPHTQCLRGILAIIGTVIGYRLILEAIKLNDAAPPGDYAVMPMLAMYGMYFCYNWICAGFSIIIALTMYFLLELLDRRSASSILTSHL